MPSSKRDRELEKLLRQELSEQPTHGRMKTATVSLRQLLEDTGNGGPKENSRLSETIYSLMQQPAKFVPIRTFEFDPIAGFRLTDRHITISIKPES